MKFLVVIPVKNGERLIVDTLESLARAANSSLESEVYISVRDGESEDNTVQVAMKWWENLENRSRLNFKIESNSDQGMYEAISRETLDQWSDIFSYIGAGDIYEPDTFLILEKIFSKSGIKWVTGRNQSFLPGSEKRVKSRNYVYRTKLIMFGVYGYLPLMPVIQQESTFWRTTLWNNIDIERFSEFLFAGDFYLWVNFAKITKLYSVDKPLAAFALHGNHKSHKGNSYKSEMKMIRTRLPMRYWPTLMADQFSLGLNFNFINENKYVLKIQ